MMATLSLMNLGIVCSSTSLLADFSFPVDTTVCCAWLGLKVIVVCSVCVPCYIVLCAVDVSW